jgi:hypothetical protein
VGKLRQFGVQTNNLFVEGLAISSAFAPKDDQERFSLGFGLAAGGVPIADPRVRGRCRRGKSDPA